MANKRQKKKQQAKQAQLAQLKRPQAPKKPAKETNAKISSLGQKSGKELERYLRGFGYSEQEINTLKQWKPKDVYYHTQQKEKNNRRREREAANKAKLMKAGYTEAEANKMKRGKADVIAQQVKNKTAGGGLYLLGFVRDKTGGNVDAFVPMDDGGTIGGTTGEWSEAVYWQKQLAKGIPISEMIGGINAALESDIGMGNIGEYAMKITTTDQIANDSDFYARSGYFRIYKGQGRTYKSLLTFINNMMSFLYLLEERDVFIQELVYNLNMLGNVDAKRNAKRIEEKFLQ